MADLSALPAHDLERLRKLAGLLASPADGERANAARMATDLLARHGMTWSEALTPAPTPAPFPVPSRSRPVHSVHPVRPVHPMRSHEAARQYIIDMGLDALNAWERGFVRDLRGLRKLSAKQAETLARIRAKVERYVTMEAAHA